MSVDWYETEKSIRATLSRMGVERDQDDVVQEVLLAIINGTEKNISELIGDAKRAQFRDYWVERGHVREFGKNPGDAESVETESSYFDYVCSGSGAINRHAYDDSDRDIGDEELHEKLSLELYEFIGWLRAKEGTKKWLIKMLLLEEQR